MPEELSNEAVRLIEIEVNRHFRDSGVSHRNFLETLFKRVIWAFGVIIGAFILYINFYYGKNFNRLEKDIETKGETLKDSLDQKAELSLKTFMDNNLLTKALEDKVDTSISGTLKGKDFDIKVQEAISKTLEKRIQEVAATSLKGLIDSSLAQSKNSNLDSIPIGVIMPYGGSNPPLGGWLHCNGGRIEIAKFPKLYEVIGGVFRPSDNTHFYLPDLSGRVPVGQGSSDLTPRLLGQAFGEEKHSLKVSEMPRHNHKFKPQDLGSEIDYVNSLGAGTEYRVIGDTKPGPGKLDNGRLFIQDEGGSQPHNNMQPSLVVNFIIKAN